MRIHLLVNPRRADAVAAAKRTAEWLKQRNVIVAADEASAYSVGVDPCPEIDLGDADLMVTFGGDGTLIRGANLCSERGTPILGVYYGRFGFVTQCTGEEVGAFLSHFFDGKAEIQDRMMLRTQLKRAGNVIAEVHALNEMVLQRSVTARMLTFQVTVDGHELATYPADGIIVSTATGSTAYNLSAGGPILDPRVQGFVITALAPHALNSRAFVIAPDSTLTLRVTTEGDESVLSADGYYRLHLLSGDEVEITKSPRITRLLVGDHDDFMRKLGGRLFWSLPLGFEEHD